MGRGRTRNKKRRAAPSRSGAKSARADPELETRVHLEQGRTKQALQAANAWRKAAPGSEADALYLESAEARIAQLGDSAQFAAAEQLAASVRERFPGALKGAGLLALRAELRGGQPDRALRELAREDLEDDRRQEIVDLLVEEIADPACVAACEAVLPDHELRRLHDTESGRRLEALALIAADRPFEGVNLAAQLMRF